MEWMNKSIYFKGNKCGVCQVLLPKVEAHFSTYYNQLEFETEKLTLVHAKYEEAKMDSESSLQHKFIVNSAFAAEKKSYPIRWLIVVVSTLASFLLTLILLLEIMMILGGFGQRKTNPIKANQSQSYLAPRCSGG